MDVRDVQQLDRPRVLREPPADREDVVGTAPDLVDAAAERLQQRRYDERDDQADAERHPPSDRHAATEAEDHGPPTADRTRPGRAPASSRVSPASSTASRLRAMATPAARMSSAYRLISRSGRRTRLSRNAICTAPPNPSASPISARVNVPVLTRRG